MIDISKKALKCVSNEDFYTAFDNLIITTVKDGYASIRENPSAFLLLRLLSLST